MTTDIQTVEAPATPRAHLTSQTEIASLFKQVVKDQGLSEPVQGKDYLRVEAWQFLGSLNGVTSVLVETERIEGGWKAVSEARRESDGQTVGAGHAICTREERRWARADDYAVLSMAQTRATSKALKSCLGHLATLSGYATTPLEEMPTEGFGDASRAQSPPVATVKPAVQADAVRVITAKQGGLIKARTGAKRLGDLWLAQTVHRLTQSSDPLPDFGGDWKAAKAWVEIQLETFPSDLMDSILEEIGNAPAKTSGTPAATLDARARRDGLDGRWGD